MQIDFYIYILFFSGLCACYSIYKKKPAPLYIKLFPILLFSGVAVEIIASIMINLYKTKAHTYIVYNPFTCLEFVFYFFVIREIVKNKKAKKVLLFLMIAYPIAALTNIYFFQGRTGFHIFTYSIGCLLIVGCCIYYFYELFLLPNSVKLLSQPAFWICTALLFFYAFTYPFFGLSNLMMTLPDTILIPVFRITELLNIILYSFFSIAFLCRLRIRK